MVNGFLLPLWVYNVNMIVNAYFYFYFGYEPDKGVASELWVIFVMHHINFIYKLEGSVTYTAQKTMLKTYSIIPRIFSVVSDTNARLVFRIAIFFAVQICRGTVQLFQSDCSMCCWIPPVSYIRAVIAQIPPMILFIASIQQNQSN